MAVLSYTLITAGLLACLYLFLTFRVIKIRRGEMIALHDGDNPALRVAIRGHGNFAEYAPLALLMLGASEASGAPGWALLIASALLIAGRALHAAGFSHDKPIMRLRVLGMVLTLFSILWLIIIGLLLVTGLLGPAAV